MTSFGATEIATNGQQCNSTFKLLLMPNESPKTGCIKLPTDFNTIIHSQADLIEQIFLDVRRQCTNHELLAERAILAGKMWTSMS